MRLMVWKDKKSCASSTTMVLSTGRNLTFSTTTTSKSPTQTTSKEDTSRSKTPRKGAISLGKTPLLVSPITTISLLRLKEVLPKLQLQIQVWMQCSRNSWIFRQRMRRQWGMSSRTFTPRLMKATMSSTTRSDIWRTSLLQWILNQVANKGHYLESHSKIPRKQWK